MQDKMKRVFLVIGTVVLVLLSGCKNNKALVSSSKEVEYDEYFRELFVEDFVNYTPVGCPSAPYMMKETVVDTSLVGEYTEIDNPREYPYDPEGMKLKILSDGTFRLKAYGANYIGYWIVNTNKAIVYLSIIGVDDLGKWLASPSLTWDHRLKRMPIILDIVDSNRLVEKSFVFQKN